MINRFRAHKARNEPFADPSNDSLTALLALHREEIAKIRSGSIFFAFSAFFSIFTTLIRDESFSDSIRQVVFAIFKRSLLWSVGVCGTWHIRDLYSHKGSFICYNIFDILCVEVQKLMLSFV